MERELRKCQSLLSQAGGGVMLFAAWRVISVNLYLGFGTLPLEMIQQEAAQVSLELGVNEKFFLVFMIILVACVMIWQLSIRLYIGLSATAEGKGKPKGWLYLLVTAVLLAAELQLAWVTFGIDRMLAGEALDKNAIISFCMEVASIYVLMELLISGVRVKLLKKKMKV